MRLWVRDTVDQLDAQLRDLQQALADKALAFAGAVMPGFTHLQSAQPVDLRPSPAGLCRDARPRPRPLARCPQAHERVPARAPRRWPAPPSRSTAHTTAQALGFDRPTANSLDSVSDRDFALEALAAASICAMHLSRFAEEIVIWTTPQFGFVRLSDRFTTGSSIMPQKRNPDAAELVRGKAGRVIGALNGAADRHEGPAADLRQGHAGGQGRHCSTPCATLSLCIAAMAGMVRDMEPELKVMKKAAGVGYATATDLADWLVRTLKMPFREAHHVTGRIVGAGLGPRRRAGEADAGRDAGRRAAHHARTSSRCWASSARCAAAPAMAARRPPKCGGRRSAGWRG